MLLFPQKIVKKTPRFILGSLIALFIITPLFIFSDFVLKDHTVYAAFNREINYQGKLTNSVNVAVSNGTYHMKFWLLTSPTAATTTALWTEDRSTTAGNRITVSNGLFSVMLGSSTPLTTVDFNQTLYLGIEIGGSAGSPTWDGEMSPRKKLGVVPAAIESDKIDGLSSEQFLRSDTSNATSTATNWLTFTQNGVGDIARFVGPSSAPVFNILSGGEVAVGTSSPSGRFTVWGAGTGTGVLVNFVNNASTSVMRILDNGNVGIGTTSPYAALSVVGQAVATYFTSTSTLVASTFPYASTTALTVAGAGGLQLNTALNGPLQAIGGLVSATSTLSVAYGGTGISTAPIYGQMLVGNSLGGYTLTATSSLGITASQWTTAGSNIHYTTGKVGIGTTSPYAALSVVGEVVASYFTATSTTATSTFFGGLVAGGTSGLTVLQNGYVGVGTSSALFGLEVAGGPTLATALFYTGTAARETQVVIRSTTISDGIGTNAPFIVKDLSNTTQAYIRQDGGMYSKFISTVDNQSVGFTQVSGNPGSNVAGLDLTASTGIGWGTTHWYTAPDVVLSKLGTGILGVGTTALGTSNGKLVAGGIGIGSSTPYASLAVISNSNTVPQLYVGTSTAGSNTAYPLFYVSATTTGDLDWARVAVGTTTSANGAGLRDQFVVSGRIYSTWREMRCDVFGASAVLSTTADTPSFCGPFALDSDTDGGITIQTDVNPSFGRIFAGGSTATLGEAGSLRSWTKNVIVGENPVMEATVKLPSAQASTLYFVGFTDTTAGSDLSTLPTNGIFFVATSTNTWRAVHVKNNSTTTVETNVATSTSLQTMRIEVSPTKTIFLINGSVVAEITGNFPTVNLAPAITVGVTATAGTVRNFDVGYLRVWYDDPPGGYGPATGGPRGPTTPPEFDPSTYNPVVGADISSAYLADNPAEFLPGTLVSSNPNNGSQVFISTEKNDPNLLGVISTETHMIIGAMAGEYGEHSVRVAVTGRVPVIVGTENGEILSGDYITSSSLPGVGMKATASGHVVGRALENYAGNGTSTILMVVEPTYYAGSALVTDANGNTGIGTTSAVYKLNVDGDLAAKGFVVNGTQASMRDVQALTDEDAQSYIESMKMITLSKYRYVTDSATTTRLGIISGDAPSEILTASGDVDLYKLATFTLVGVKAQQLKIEALEERVAEIELSITEGSLGGFSFTSILENFERFGVKITNGIARFRTIIVDRIIVGSPEKPNGITLYDEVTGEPYCVKISNGKLKNIPGECGLLLPEVEVVPHATPATSVSGDVTVDLVKVIPDSEPLPSLENPEETAGEPASPSEVGDINEEQNVEQEKQGSQSGEDNGGANSDSEAGE